jgi:hypothetical protein
MTDSSAVHVRVTSGNFAMRYVVKIWHAATDANLIVRVGNGKGQFTIAPGDTKKITMGAFDRIPEVQSYLSGLSFEFSDGRDFYFVKSSSKLVAIGEFGLKMDKVNRKLESVNRTLDGALATTVCMVTAAPPRRYNIEN